MGWFSKPFGRAKKEKAMKMEEAAPGARTVKDPVCGMDVDVGKAPAMSIYQGQTYYFCAVGCKKAFEQDPAKYTERRGQMKGGMHHH